MNVLFLSVMCMTSLDESNIYSDLIKEFIAHGHYVDVICPIEERYDFSDKTVVGKGFSIYYQHVGNITNTGFVEKGKSVLKISRQMIGCIKRNVGCRKVDLFLIAVPPVNFEGVVSYVKKQYKAKVYLLLKDIWPASMFDLNTPGGALVKQGVSAVFRYWEKKLYKEADMIGCLSDGNVRYVLKNNQYLDSKKVEVNPNVITPRGIKPQTKNEKEMIRRKHHIPIDKICFIYGGTLGVGQNVEHIVRCLRACSDLDCHFVISGKGIQYQLLEEYIKYEHPTNLTLINGLPKSEYELMMHACDVGLVFLRYTAQTPNIPSRILSYMEYSLPVLTCLDPVSDLTQIVEEGKFGWGCLSNDASAFRAKILEAMQADLKAYKENSRRFLEEHYTAARSYNIIMDSVGECRCN